MQQAEIRQKADATARDLGLPWDGATATVSRPLLGVLSSVWWVTSRVTAQSVTTVIGVRETTGDAWPVTVRYDAEARLGRGPRLRFLAVHLLIGLTAGSLIYVAGRELAEMSTAFAALAGGFWGVIAAATSLRLRRLDAQ